MELQLVLLLCIGLRFPPVNCQNFPGYANNYQSYNLLPEVGSSSDLSDQKFDHQIQNNNHGWYLVDSGADQVLDNNLQDLPTYVDQNQYFPDYLQYQQYPQYLQPDYFQYPQQDFPMYPIDQFDYSGVLNYSPCNPSPSKLLIPAIAPSQPCYECPPPQPQACYDCPPQPCYEYECQPPVYEDPCLSPCNSVDPCYPPIPDTRCKLDFKFSVSNVDYYISSPKPGLTWFKANEMIPDLDIKYPVNIWDRENWRLADVTTQHLIDTIWSKIESRGCDPNSLLIWVGGNRLLNGNWVWSDGSPIEESQWNPSDTETGNCMMLKEKKRMSGKCGFSSQKDVVFLAQSGLLEQNFETTSESSKPTVPTKPTAKPTETTSGEAESPTTGRPTTYSTTETKPETTTSRPTVIPETETTDDFVEPPTPSK